MSEDNNEIRKSAYFLRLPYITEMKLLIISLSKTREIRVVYHCFKTTFFFFF